MWVNNQIRVLYVVVVIDIEPIRERFSAVAPFLDERGRRLVAAAEAFAAGYGGIAADAMASGVAPSTIGRGLQELAQDEPSERVRRPGAGRKRTISESLPPRGRGTRRCFRISRRWSSPGRRRGRLDTRGSGIAVAVARQERAPPGAGAARASSRGQPHPGRPLTCSSPTCSMRRVTVCKATARPPRATATPTGRRSSPPSTPK